MRRNTNAKTKIGHESGSQGSDVAENWCIFRSATVQAGSDFASPEAQRPIKRPNKEKQNLGTPFPTTALTRLGIFHLLIWLPIDFLTAAVVGR